MIKTASQKIINNILPDNWFCGRALKGKGRGRKIGFPTINLFLNTPFVLKNGVYLTLLKIENKNYYGLLHYGPRLIYQEIKPQTEIYVLNFKKNVKLGTKIKFKPLVFLRKTKKFPSEKGLKLQIKTDVKKAKNFLKSDKV
ncbi:riboflavin kinase [Patescibacteria group bacterium]